jgi:hypothetical protein
MLTLVGSLICLCSHFGDLDIPLKCPGFPVKNNSEKFISLRKDICSILRDLLRKSKDSEITCSLLWNASVFIMDAIEETSRKKFGDCIPFIRDLLKEILAFSSDSAIYTNKLNVLGTLSQYSKELFSIDQNLIKMILEGLCEYISNGLKDGQCDGNV